MNQTQHLRLDYWTQVWFKHTAPTIAVGLPSTQSTFPQRLICLLLTIFLCPLRISRHLYNLKISLMLQPSKLQCPSLLIHLSRLILQPLLGPFRQLTGRSTSRGIPVSSSWVCTLYTEEVTALLETSSLLFASKIQLRLRRLPDGNRGSFRAT